MEQRTRNIVLCLVAAAITLLVFLPSLANHFVTWDDGQYVVNNPFIRGLSAENLRALWTSACQGNYHPLTMLSFALNYAAGDLQPFGYHAVNLFLHLCNVVLVFWFIYLLSAETGPAFLTALLFGIHPMHVESVAWISARKDVLYAFFFLASLISYLYARRGGGDNKRRWLLLSLGCFVLSLLSKAMAVVLPLALLLVDYYDEKRVTRQAVLGKLWFFAATAAFGIAAIIVQQSSGATRTAYALHPLFNALVALKGLSLYLVKLLFPLHLSCLYRFPMERGEVFALSFVLPAALIAGAWAWFVYRTRKDGKLLFGNLFFLLAILPVLQFLPVGQALIAERYTYVSYIGLFYVIAVLVSRLYRSGDELTRACVKGCGLALLCLLALLSSLRCRVWKDGRTLWSDVIARQPRTALAWENRGLWYALTGDYEKALADYRQALSLSPRSAEAWFNMGLVLSTRGNDAAAISCYTKAIESDPSFGKAYNNRGWLHVKAGKTDLASADFRKALELDARDYRAAANLRALRERGPRPR